MSTGFYAFHGAIDLNDVREVMSKLLKNAGDCRPVALFYGRPTCRVMKEVILPDIKYFHFRSRNDAECFCVGYVPFEGDYYTPTADPVHNMFQPEAFASSVKELEDHTPWKYAGQTELILLNVYRPPNSKQALLDFTTVISFCLEDAEKSGAIRSAGEFLETFFRFAINYRGKEFTYDFSNHLGLREAASSLKQIWFKVLPSPLGDGVKHALNWYVKDFSNVEVTSAALRAIDQADDSILEFYGEPLGRRIVKEKQRILKGEQ
jgi:hypothetical protein